LRSYSGHLLEMAALCSCVCPLLLFTTHYVQFGLPYLAFRSCHFNKVYSEFDLLSVILKKTVQSAFSESKLIVKFPYTSSASPRFCLSNMRFGTLLHCFSTLEAKQL